MNQIEELDGQIDGMVTHVALLEGELIDARAALREADNLLLKLGEHIPSDLIWAQWRAKHLEAVEAAHSRDLGGVVQMGAGG